MPEKIDRSAFLYLEGADDSFAQCESCYQFIPEKQRCRILGKDDDVLPGDTCGLYILGDNAVGGTPLGLITKDDADFARRKVQCRNCYYGGSQCGLYVTLNVKFPNMFKLKTEIKPHGCCNANTPKANLRAQVTEAVRKG